MVDRGSLRFDQQPCLSSRRGKCVVEEFAVDDIRVRPQQDSALTWGDVRDVWKTNDRTDRCFASEQKIARPWRESTCPCFECFARNAPRFRIVDAMISHGWRSYREILSSLIDGGRLVLTIGLIAIEGVAVA
ncbi:MAG: hypothetical protein ABS64_00995 [Microbacterium sp. SCN 69-37]|nr:MAG: hypothetical protein ABS64_00995 [Microbacterium sp. SCN 69-37]